MGIFSIILIAIIEAMDCFAVSISTGLCKSNIPYSRAMLQSVSFGVFQGGMTLLGYFLGVFTERWFSAIGTPIACGILCILGLRMIWGATHESDDDGEKSCNLSIPNILLLSVATSIDAFAVGVSFAFMQVNLWLAVIAIAIASFVMGVVGFEIGRHSAKHFKTKIPEIIAGVILIGVGVKLFF
ncbi:MAG: manganese efflux pump [Fibrobacteraceae bacterium]|nr:manganese efflux pump [Fibrobacteraceae bacterium]